MFEAKKQLMWSKLKVGIVLTIAVLILFFTAFFAGRIEDIFVPKADILIRINDVKGLRNGSPVWIAGIEVGSVKNMKLHEQHGTLVTVSIREDLLTFIKNDSKATVQTMGLLGDKYIELSSGSPGAPSIKKGDMIEGRPQLEIKDIVDASAGSIGKITDFVEKLDRFLLKIEKSEGTLGQFISDPSIYRNLSDATKRLSLLLGEIETPKGTLGLLIKDPALYTKIAVATEKIDNLISGINDGKGTLGKLATDISLYNNLSDTSAQLASIVQGINEKEGLAGMLLKDKELAGEFKQTVMNLKEAVDELKLITKDIKENPKKYFKFSIF